MNIVIKKENVTVEDFKFLRKSVEWPIPPDNAIETSIKNTVWCVVVYVDDKIAGMGRIVGDNAFIFFIADIIVIPKLQGKKIGKAIMNEIMEYLDKNAPKNSYITLMAAKGKEEFYKKFGFFERPTDKLGAGMMVELR